MLLAELYLKIVTFICSIVAFQIYEALGKVCPKVRRIFIRDATYEANLQDLFQYFPNLKSLNGDCYLSKTWMTEIMTTENHSLMSLSVTYSNETSQFEPFDFNDLLTCLKVQKLGFELSLFVMDKAGRFTKFFTELRKFLNKNLLSVYTKIKVCTRLTVDHHVNRSSPTKWHLR
uniref:F-box/LRR-repeat protein n=1 Tax=Panagrellus redivivus TaxID=6233 RepID=A0A7E4VUE3_PANRE